MIFKDLKIYFLLIIIAILTGCQTMGKIGQVIADPDIPIGEMDDRPTKISLSIVGEDFINLNYDGQPTPIRLDFIQLKDDSNFLAGDYDSFNWALEELLGKNYITHDEYSINPAGHQYIDPFELEPQTRYIGIVAHYSDIDDVLWKKIVKIKGTGDEAHLLILAKEDEIKFDRMER